MSEALVYPVFCTVVSRQNGFQVFHVGYFIERQEAIDIVNTLNTQYQRAWKAWWSGGGGDSKEFKDAYAEMVNPMMWVRTGAHAHAEDTITYDYAELTYGFRHEEAPSFPPPKLCVCSSVFECTSCKVQECVNCKRSIPAGTEIHEMKTNVWYCDPCRAANAASYRTERPNWFITGPSQPVKVVENADAYRDAFETEEDSQA